VSQDQGKGKGYSVEPRGPKVFPKGGGWAKDIGSSDIREPHQIFQREGKNQRGEKKTGPPLRTVSGGQENAWGGGNWERDEVSDGLPNHFSREKTTAVWPSRGSGQIKGSQ